MMKPALDIGIFGGSGLYALLDDIEEVTVDTPWGEPSAPIHIGMIGDRPIAFLSRHGTDHEHPAHRVNYRANLWAMRELGVRRIFGPCAAGSLRADIHPGDFVVCDQLVDRTTGRPDTFFEGPGPNHMTFADPYCATLGQVLAATARDLGIPVHERGTVVVVQGPRFSTRAESQWYAAQGWDVVNMTQYPESVLARELGICYATVALVTDYDAGLQGAQGVEPVTQSQVFSVLETNIERVRTLMHAAVDRLPPEYACDHQNGLSEPTVSRAVARTTRAD